VCSTVLRGDAQSSDHSSRMRTSKVAAKLDEQRQTTSALYYSLKTPFSISLLSLYL